VCDQASCEGQAAMQLEFACVPNIVGLYDYAVHPGETLVIDWEPMVRQIISEHRNHENTGVIAAKFHNTLAVIVADIAHRIGQPHVLLTGGCFQNRYLTERTVQR